MILYILNFLDLLTTAIVLGMGGIELNPVADFLIGVHPMLYVFCKLVVGGWLILVLILTESRKSIRILCWFYAAVVAWNLFVICLLGGALWQ